MTALLIVCIFVILCLKYGLSRSSADKTQLCPSVFVIPDDPIDKDIEWVNGTTCAIGCRTPVWTEQEWFIMDTIGTVFTYIGVPMDAIVIATWSLNKEKRKKQYFVLTFAICSFLVQITLMYTAVTSFEKNFCRSNAVYIRPADGFTLCSFQNFFTFYGVFGGGVSWTLQSVDIYLKVVLGWKNTEKFKPLFLLSIFGSPIIFLIIMFSTDQYGYAPGQSFCFMIEPSEQYFFDLPLLIFISIGSFSIFSVIFKIIRHVFSMRHTTVSSSTKSSSGGSNDIFKVVKNACLFVLSYYAFSFPVMAYRYYIHTHFLYDHNKTRIANMQPWIDCIFAHFDGTDASWRSICGLYPKERMPIVLATAAISVCAHGTALLISSTYMIQPSVWKIWYRWLGIERIEFTRHVVRVSVKSGVVAPVTRRSVKSKSTG